MGETFKYLWNGELVNGTSLSIVNGDFVSWNRGRVVGVSIGDSYRRLKLRGSRFTAEFQRIEGVISGFPRGELPVKCCWFEGNWATGGTWSSNIHFGCFSLSLSLSPPLTNYPQPSLIMTNNNSTLVLIRNISLPFRSILLLMYASGQNNR